MANAKILVVEDEGIIAKSIQNVLKRCVWVPWCGHLNLNSNMEPDFKRHLADFNTFKRLEC